MNPARGTGEHGFTLVELLVVVVVVAVLSAIAVPVFLGQRQRAADAALQQDLRSLALHEETYFTDRDDYLAFSATTTPVLIDTIHLSAGVSASAQVNSTRQAYCLRVTSDRATGPRVHISSQGGLQPAGVTSCPAAAAY